MSGCAVVLAARAGGELTVSLLTAKPHTISLERPTFTRSGMGEAKSTAATAHVGIGCWIQAAPAKEINLWKERAISVSHKIFLDPADFAKFVAGDTVVVTAGPTYVGLRLIYRAGGERSAGLGLLSTAMTDEEIAS